jgi:NAD(P)-dependent dehydrogenase (short-subunit alcohol dehydrogenase family)
MTSEAATDADKATALTTGLSTFAKHHPWGAVGAPEHVAATIMYLSSPAASFITGLGSVEAGSNHPS